MSAVDGKDAFRGNFSLQIILIRYRALGAEEEARLRAEYEEQGKEEEKKVSRE